MNINRCQDCRSYKFLINGKCRDCLYKGVKDINSSDTINGRFTSGNNMQLTIGQIGSGFQVISSAEIAREMKYERDDLRVYIIDPLNHYGNLCSQLGGESISNPHDHINLLGIPDNIDTITSNMYDTAVSFSTNFLNNLMTHSGRLDKHVQDIIAEAVVRRMYHDNGVKPGSKNTSTQISFSELQETINKAIKDPRILNIQKFNSKSKVSSAVSQFNQILDNINTDILQSSAKFKPVDSNGNNLRCYNPNLSKSPGVVQKEILKHIYLSESGTDKKALVVVNESHLMLQFLINRDLNIIFNDNTSDFSLNLETQSVSDFKGHDRFLDCFDYKRIHRISLSDAEKDILGLTDQQIRFISNAKVWNKMQNEVECLINTGSDFKMTNISVTNRESDLYR